MKTTYMESQREKIIWNFFDPQASFDIGDLYEWLAPDVILVEAEGLPWSGIYYGPKGIGDYMTKITQYMISQIELDEIFSCNDKVVGIGRSIGRVVKTKLPFTIRVVLSFTFNAQDQIKKVEFLPNLPELQKVLHGKLTLP